MERMPLCVYVCVERERGRERDSEREFPATQKALGLSRCETSNNAFPLR
jgi:hypothetical protein